MLDTDNTAEKIMQGQKWADPEIGGINDAFDKLFDPQNQDPQPSPANADTKVSQDPEPVKTGDGTTTPQKPAVADSSDKKEVVVDEIKIDDDFFEDDQAKPDDAVIADKQDGAVAFDEKSFDKETEESVKGMEEHAGSKFKALRQELKEMKQKSISPDVEKKLSELELKAAEADGLRQRIDELSNQSAKMRVESSDEFAKEIKKPVDELYAKTEEIANTYEGDPAFLWSIVAETDRKKQNELIKEHLGEFSDFDKSEVYRMSQDFGRLVSKRNEMLKDADKRIQKMEAEKIREVERTIEEHKRTVQTHQRDLWRKYKDSIPGLVDEEGKETSEFKSLMAKSLSIDFSRARPKDQAFAAFSGVILKHMVGQINELRKQIAEYEASDEKYVRSRPSTGDSVTKSAASSNTDDKKSFVQRFAEADLV